MRLERFSTFIKRNDRMQRMTGSENAHGMETLISNAVMSNGGDAAMILALHKALDARGFPTAIASTHSALIQERYPAVRIVDPGLSISIARKIPYLHQGLVHAEAFQKSHRQAKIIVSSPGGQFNDNYGCTGVAGKLKSLAIQGKTVGIYAQSFGPLSGRNAQAVASMAKHIQVLMTRDAYSYEVLTSDLHIPKEKVLLSNDSAFLIPPTFQEKPERISSEGISVRKWRYDHHSEAHYIKLIAHLSTELVNKGIRVTFISTCQGIEEYHDDSKFAKQIRQLLFTRGIEVDVNSGFHTPESFMTEVSRFDAFIGTRMHACIMSLLQGNATMNIAYEQKSRELYRSIGLAEDVLEYNEPLESAGMKLQSFLSRIPAIRNKLKEVIPKEHEHAKAAFEAFMERLI